jgi:hypothetical protein
VALDREQQTRLDLVNALIEIDPAALRILAGRAQARETELKQGAGRDQPTMGDVTREAGEYRTRAKRYPGREVWVDLYSR